MASEVDQLLKVYSAHVAVPWQAGLSGTEKVWFLVYRPENDRRVHFRLEDFESATRDAGHGWLRVDLADRYSKWLAGQRNKAGYLARPSAIPEKRFTEDLITDLIAEVGGAGPGDVVVLTSTVALFGVAKLSEIIKGTENRKPGIDAHIKGRLMVLFPGSRENNSYRFLESGDGWNYLAVPLTATSASA